MERSRKLVIVEDGLEKYWVVECRCGDVRLRGDGGEDEGSIEGTGGVVVKLRVQWRF